jgi:hypothetical protein
VLPDPFADVIGKSFVELIEVTRDDKPVASDIATIADCEVIGLIRLLFNGTIVEINGSIFNCGSIALQGDSPSKGI